MACKNELFKETVFFLSFPTVYWLFIKTYLQYMLYIYEFKYSFPFFRLSMSLRGARSGSGVASFAGTSVVSFLVPASGCQVAPTKAGPPRSFLRVFGTRSSGSLLGLHPVRISLLNQFFRHLLVASRSQMYRI